MQGNTEERKDETTISIRDLVFMVLNNWYWFVISVVVCLVAAGFIYKAQPKTYTATGTIMVRDNGNSVKYNARNMDQIMNSMGWDNSNLSLSNEIYMLRSSSLMAQVVKRLNMHYYCNRQDLFRKITYYNNAPVELTVYDSNTERLPKLDLKITLKANNKYSYEILGDKYKHTAKALKGEAYFSQPINVDDTVSFRIEKTKDYDSRFDGVRLYVGVTEPLTMARGMISNLTVCRAWTRWPAYYPSPTRTRTTNVRATLWTR